MDICRCVLFVSLQSLFICLNKFLNNIANRSIFCFFLCGMLHHIFLFDSCYIEIMMWKFDYVVYALL
jgi:hypothetical protein